MVRSDNSKVYMLERLFIVVVFQYLALSYYLCLVVSGNANFWEGQKRIN